MKAQNNRSSKQVDQDNVALLVIDVQRGLFERPNPVHKAEELLQNINSLVDRAHAANVPVFYIQHSGEEILLKGSPGWQFHAGLHPLVMDSIVHKRHGNAFEETSLDEALKARNVTSLVLTGLVSHGCVKATCLGALDLGYKVILVKDAHSNLSKQAAKIIAGLNQKMSLKGVALQATSEISFRK
jgi:nicotinamidase-related amidase